MFPPPSAGVVSAEGHYPNMSDKEFQKLLTIGPISRSACDLKLALQIMAGEKSIELKLDTKVNDSTVHIATYTTLVL